MQGLDSADPDQTTLFDILKSYNLLERWHQHESQRNEFGNR